MSATAAVWKHIFLAVAELHERREGCPAFFGRLYRANRSSDRSRGGQGLSVQSHQS